MLVLKRHQWVGNGGSKAPHVAEQMYLPQPCYDPLVLGSNLIFVQILILGMTAWYPWVSPKSHHIKMTRGDVTEMFLKAALSQPDHGNDTTKSQAILHKEIVATA